MFERVAKKYEAVSDSFILRPYKHTSLDWEPSGWSAFSSNFNLGGKWATNYIHALFIWYWIILDDLVC